jgi:lysophospholipase L1-like esterase
MPRRGRFFRLLAVLLAIAVALLGAEVFVRHAGSYVTTVGGVTHPLTSVHFSTPAGPRLLPNVELRIHNHPTSGRSVTLRTNSLGMREAEVLPDRAPGEVRIVAMGDSITLADYLPAEEVYLKRAETELRRRLRRDVRVLNSGLGGSDLTQQVTALAERVPHLRPDIVMLGFYLNDVAPIDSPLARVQTFGWLRRRSVLADVIFRSLALRGWVKDQGAERFRWHRPEVETPRWASRREDFARLVWLARHEWGAAWIPTAWARVDRDLSQIQELSRRYGFDVVVLCFPVAFQIYAEFLDDQPQKLMEQRAAHKGWAYLDLLPLLRSQRDRRLVFDHCHPNELGNELVGRAVADLIVKRLPPG